MKILFADLKVFLILCLISLFLILFDSLGSLSLPKSFIQHLTIPVQYGLYQSSRSVTRQFDFLVTIRKSALENKALKKQLGDLLVENASLRKQLSENAALMEQYGKLNPQTFNLLPTRPIGLGTGKYLTIDKGSNDGVTEGQAVVFKDTLLGQIKQVSPKTSIILTTTDPDSKIPAYSQNGAGRSKGILLGQFGSEILMDKILHQEPIEVGDLIYTEGSEGKFPKGLIIGKVSEVLERQNEVFKQAKIEPIYDALELDMMFVIKNP